MKIKKPLIYLIAIASVGFLITSASSLPKKQASSEGDEINAEYLFVQSQPLLKTKNIEKSIQPLFYGVPITDGDYDEYHPSIAGSPVAGFYAIVEESADDIIWQPTLYGSEDGVVWEPVLTALYDNVEYTDMDQNAYGTYGTFGAPPSASGQIIVMQGEIEDGWVWDFGGDNINEFRYNRIACYTFEGPEGDPGTWNWGGLTFTGYNGYGGNNIVGCPFIFYPSSADRSGIIAGLEWLSVSGCQHTGSSMDLANNILYSVYDRNTGSTWELLVRKDNFAQWIYNPTNDYWTHQYMTSVHVTDALNLTYPSVAAYDNNVIVTCMKDNDVIAYYSTNGFVTKTEVLIEEDAFYPEVVFAAEGKAFLTYIKDNVLYYVTSDDGGATWSTAQVVSDNQVNFNDRAANLDEFRGSVYGVWEDTRGDNTDAYFDIIYEFINNPPTAPKIRGPHDKPKIKNLLVAKLLPKPLPKPGTYNFTFNATDPEGQDVSYYIEWGDGTSTGWIGPFPSGEEILRNHTWYWKDKFMVRAKAKDIYNLEGPVGEEPIVIKHMGKFVINLRFIEILKQILKSI